MIQPPPAIGLCAVHPVPTHLDDPKRVACPIPGCDQALFVYVPSRDLADAVEVVKEIGRYTIGADKYPLGEINRSVMALLDRLEREH